MQTREHVYNGLAQYSDDQSKIELIILEIGEDPDAAEYPDGTLEKGLEFFLTLGKAMTKAIESGREDKAIAIQEAAIPMLEKAGMNFPPEIVLLFAEAAVQEGSSVALGMDALRVASYERTKKTTDVKFAKKVLEDLGANSNIIEEVFNPVSIQAFIEAEVVAVPDWEAEKYLAELNAVRERRTQLLTAKEQQQAALPKPQVNVAAFLAGRK